MNIRIIAAIAAFMMMICARPVCAQEEENPAQRLLTTEEIAVAADTIIAQYPEDWQQLSMQGRMQFDGVPMRLSVKVYMERGKSILISARAPIFGEMARVEILGDSITLINKSSRTYHTISPASGQIPTAGMIADLQDILLGEIALPGQGRLTPELSQQAQWIDLSDGRMILFPDPSVQLPGSQSGFIIDSTEMQLLTFALAIPSQKIEAETSYQYGEEGWTLGVNISINGKPLKGEFQLSYPDYSPTPLEPTDISKRYRAVAPADLMK